MTYRVLNPTSETSATQSLLAPRLTTVKGATVGLISNGKEGSKGFFSHLTHLLKEELGVANVVLRHKPNYSAPAPLDIIDEAAQWDLAITGLGD
jgi:hypothetical protein